MVGVIVIGMAAGLVATLVMDTLNRIATWAGITLPIRYRMIGKVTRGWLRGRFTQDGRHSPDADAMSTFRVELLGGLATHYLIGGALGAAFRVGWELWIGDPVALPWAVGYGVATTVFAWFVMLPAVGLGLFGLRSPHGLRLPISSLVNHLFYGLGLAAAIAWLPV